MIVISHPWEFVPKGSSHLTSLSTSSSNSTSGTTISSGGPTTSSSASNNNPGLSNKAITDPTGSKSTESSNTQTNQQQQQHPYFYLQKNHINRIFQSQNISLNGGKSKPPQFQAPSGEDSSLSDISFAYLHKSPLVNKINFETSVSFAYFLSPQSHLNSYII